LLEQIKNWLWRKNSLQASLLDGEFMKGQLALLGQRVITLDSDGKIAAANNAAILQQLTDSQNEQLSHLPALQRLSNKDLQETVYAFSKRLKSEDKGLEKLDDDLALNERRFLYVTNPSPEQLKFMADATDKRKAWYSALASIVAQESRLATGYRDELIRRLGQNEVMLLNWPSEDPNKPIRPERIFGYAMYLENMAGKLSS
jgi:hypothetical protein